MLIAASSCDQPDGIIRRKHLPLAALAILHLDVARGEPLRADDDLPWQADEVEGSELRAGALVAVVVEHLTASPLELVVEAGTGGIGRGIAHLQIGQANMERCDRLRPDDTIIVVARLDDGRGEARGADPVRAHVDRGLSAVWPIDDCAHRLGILDAEVENMADLDAAGGDPYLRG